MTLNHSPKQIIAVCLFVAFALAVLYPFTDHFFMLLIVMLLGYFYLLGMLGSKLGNITLNDTVSDVMTAKKHIENASFDLPKLIITLYANKTWFFAAVFFMTVFAFVAGILLLSAVLPYFDTQAIKTTPLYFGIFFGGLATWCSIGALKETRHSKNPLQKETVILTPQILHIEAIDNNKPKSFNFAWQQVKDIHEYKHHRGGAAGYVVIIAKPYEKNGQMSTEEVYLETDRLHYSNQQVSELFIAYRSRALGQPIKRIK